jgi:hypothetical protein
MNHRTFIIITILIVLGTVAEGGTVAHAKTHITNSISVSADTGHNRSAGGAVSEGKSTASSTSITTIHGELLENIHRQSTTSSINITQTVSSRDYPIPTDAPVVLPPVVTSPARAQEKSMQEEAPSKAHVENTSHSVIHVNPLVPVHALYKPRNYSVVEERPNEEEKEVSLSIKALHSLHRALTYVISTIFF